MEKFDQARPDQEKDLMKDMEAKLKDRDNLLTYREDVTNPTVGALSTRKV